MAKTPNFKEDSHSTFYTVFGKYSAKSHLYTVCLLTIKHSGLNKLDAWNNATSKYKLKVAYCTVL